MSNLGNAFNSYSYTNNGALTNSSSGNALLDLFFLVGGARHTNRDDILSVFNKAYQADAVGALKTLFYARDRDGGAGERRVFRVIFHSLPIDVQKALAPFVPVYGRWDDLWRLNDKKNVSLVHLDYLAENLLHLNQDETSLLTKWLPRKGLLFSALAKRLNLSYGDLRRKIVSHSKTVEQLLCSKSYDEIQLTQIPSRALLKYTDAFSRIFGEKFTEFLSSGKSKSDFFYPYDVYRKAANGEKVDVLQPIWDNIPSDFQGEGKKFLPVIDVSGSMEGTPMEIAVSTGLFLAERQKGEFHNEFITFSESPEFVQIPDSLNIVEKFRFIRSSEWGYNTNLGRVFDELLSRAKNRSLSQSDMPNAIVIISDMEFNGAMEDYNSETTLERIKKKYAENGYDMPVIIFWNVAGRKNNIPGVIGDKVILFSGSNPKNIEKIFNFDKIELNPYAIFSNMVLDNPRYDFIYAVV